MEQKTIHDEFAMAALTGLLASGNDHYDGHGDENRYAVIAYRFAEEMMKEREKYNKE